MGFLSNHTLAHAFDGLLAELPSVSLGESLALIEMSSVMTHLIYKRWEPLRLSVTLTLLMGVPAALSVLLIPHLGLLRGALATFSLYLSTLISSIVAYRLSPWHPLARYPGPLPARVTQLWHTWQAHKGQQHLYLKQMHDKYGDVVRMGPNEISIRDADCIVPLYGPHGLPKGPSWSGRQMHPQELSLIGYRDPARHSVRRKPWARGLGTAAVREYMPALRSRVSQLVDALGARSGHPVDLAEWIAFFAYDFMGDMAFGGWTEMMRDGVDKEGFWDMIHMTLKAGAVFEQVPWLAYYAKMLPAISQRILKMRKLTVRHATRRYNSGSFSRDLFHYLSGEDLPEGSARPPQHIVAADGLLAVVAGSDTTASALSNLFYCIMRHRDVYKRLQQEVDQFSPLGDDSLDPQHLNNMPYLNAVINETLRYLPSVLSGSQRAPLIGGGGVSVGPYYVPEGNQVRVHFYSVHRDPRYFSDPDRFWPERWLIADDRQPSSEKIVHDDRAFIPFSYGPSNCVGKGLALQQMKSTVCHVMAKLEMRFADGYDPDTWEEQVQDEGVMIVGSLPVVIKRRL